MAALTYRCEVGADCPDQHEPGYCPNHPTDMLRPVREQPTPTTPQEPGTQNAPLQRRPVAVRFHGRRFAVPADGLILGRSDGPLADVPEMADLTQVSRRHAQLYWIGDMLYIRDEHSKNGTFVDGVQICDPRRITVGQQLRLALDVPIELVDEDLDEFGLPR